MDYETQRAGMGQYWRQEQSEAMSVFQTCLDCGADSGHVGFCERLNASLADAIGLERARQYARRYHTLRVWTYGGARVSDDVDYLTDEGSPDVIASPTTRKRMYSSLAIRARQYPTCGMFAQWLRHEAQRLARHSSGMDTALALIFAELHTACLDVASILDDAIPGNGAREMVLHATSAMRAINADSDKRKQDKAQWAALHGANVGKRSWSIGRPIRPHHKGSNRDEQQHRHN